MSVKNDEVWVTLLGGLAGLVVVVALITGAAVSQGVAIAILWGWFAVPLLGLPAITYLGAIGLVLVIGAFKGPYLKKMESDKASTIWLKLYLTPWWYVFLGWIVTLFI